MALPKTPSTTFVNFRPQRLPDSACCTDPAYLCPKCMAAALHEAGLQTIAAEPEELVLHRGPSGTINGADDRPAFNKSDYLPLPGPIFDEPAKQPIVTSQRVPEHDDLVLPLTLDELAAEEARDTASQGQRIRADSPPPHVRTERSSGGFDKDDILPLPRTFG